MKAANGIRGSSKDGDHTPKYPRVDRRGVEVVLMLKVLLTMDSSPLNI